MKKITETNSNSKISQIKKKNITKKDSNDDNNNSASAAPTTTTTAGNTNRSSFRNNKFLEEEIPAFINMEQLKENLHEIDEHHNFKSKFLGKEGKFSDYSGNF